MIAFSELWPVQCLFKLIDFNIAVSFVIFQELAKFEHELLVLYKKHFKSCFFVKIGANTVINYSLKLIN